MIVIQASLLMPAALVAAKVAFVLAVAWVALALMRRTSAATRHLVVASALVTSLALPVLSILVPSWEVLPVPGSVLGFRSAVGETVDVSPAERLPMSAEGMGDRRAEVIPRGDASWVASERPVAPAWSPNAVDVWILGALAFLGLLGLQVLATTWRVARATPIEDPAWLALVEEIRHRLAIDSSVALRRHPTRAMPLAWGIAKPTILLPADCETWPAARRHAILAHELAHVVRRDVAVLLLGHVACALHWFIPFTWLLKRRLVLEGELASDARVVALGGHPAHYARHLLETARDYRKRIGISPVMAARSQLEGRIMAIIESNPKPTTVHRNHRRLLIALVAVAILPLASLGLVGVAPVAEASGEDANRARPESAWSGQSDSALFEAELARLGLREADPKSWIDALDSSNALTRAAAVWALGRSEDEGAVAPLIAALGDADPRTRQWAARGLDGFADPRAVPPLLERLEDDDAEVRQWAIRSLEPILDERAIRPLIERSEDEDAEVREWAVRTLASLDSDSVAVALRERLEDPSPDVREWAARAMAASATPRPMPPGLQADGREALMPGLGERRPIPGDDQDIAALIRSLDDADADVREWAARSLAEIGDERAVWPLIERIRDDANADVREWAIRALAWLGDPDATDPLINALDDAHPDIREWAVRSLGVLQDERMVSPLIERLGDDHPAVREWSARALGAYGDLRAVAPIERLLDDDDADVRYWAGRALETLDSGS